MSTNTISIYEIKEFDISNSFLNDLESYLSSGILLNNNDIYFNIKKRKNLSRYYDRNTNSICDNNAGCNNSKEMQIINLAIDYGVKNNKNLKILKKNKEQLVEKDDYLLRLYYLSIIIFNNNIYIISQYIDNKGAGNIFIEKITDFVKNKYGKKIDIKRYCIPVTLQNVENLEVITYTKPQNIEDNIKYDKMPLGKMVFTFNRKGKKLNMSDAKIINATDEKNDIIKNINCIYKMNIPLNLTDTNIFVEVKIENKIKRIQIDNLRCFSRIEINEYLEADEDNNISFEKINKEIIEHFKDVVIGFDS